MSDKPDWKYKTDGSQWPIDIQLKRLNLDAEIINMHITYYRHNPLHPAGPQRTSANKARVDKLVTINNNIRNVRKKIKN
jgi:hypothetical protein